MENVLEFKVNSELTGVRIDKFLNLVINDLSRSAIQKLIDNQNIMVNDKVISKNYKVKQNDFLKIYIPKPEVLDVIPQDIPIDIVYEDNALIVINKQKDMVVHPAAGHNDNTLVNAVLYHCQGKLSSINGVIRPGIVHRIDKDTSGLLVIAKNDKSHISLANQIKDHTVTREYVCITHGVIKQDDGIIDLNIGRSQNDRKKMCITDKNAKNAITHFEVIERFNKFTYCKLNLETGRTHQIRVHLAYMGYPIAGDQVYGPKKCITELNGQCLHAKKLGFIHPTTNQYLEFDSKLPEYFEKFLIKSKKIY